MGLFSKCKIFEAGNNFSNFKIPYFVDDNLEKTGFAFDPFFNTCFPYYNLLFRFR